MTIETYWKKFLIDSKLPKDTTYFESFYFGADKASATNLLQLVLNGEKTATSSAQDEYILNNEREPKVDDYSIVTDFEGNPKCIIKTTKVKKLAFEEMTYDLCRLEGEDLILKTWQDKHIEFFKVIGKENGYQFKWTMIIIFEIFEVVYK